MILLLILYIKIGLELHRSTRMSRSKSIGSKPPSSSHESSRNKAVIKMLGKWYIVIVLHQGLVSTEIHTASYDKDKRCHSVHFSGLERGINVAYTTLFVWLVGPLRAINSKRIFFFFSVPSVFLCCYRFLFFFHRFFLRVLMIFLLTIF